MNRLFLTVSTLFIIACNSDDMVGMVDKTVDGATSEIVIAVSSTTKGEIVVDPEDMGSVAVYCALTGEDEWSSTTKFTKLNNCCYTLSSDGSWRADNGTPSWGYNIESDNYTFFAYSPHCDNAEGLTSYIESGEMVIGYIVPTNSVDQPDLMVAKPQKNISAEIDGGLQLNMFHALSCISFGVESASTDKIKSINISGVVNEGVMRWDYDSNAPVWSLVDSRDSTFVVNVDSYTMDDSGSGELNSDQSYLMMIPQLLEDGAKVSVEFEKRSSIELSIPKGSEWEVGRKYNYVINLDGEDSGFIFDSSQISNCYIINPTKGENTVVQIPIEDRINDFWENYSRKQTTKITPKNVEDDFYVTVVWEDFDTTFELDYDIVEDSDGKMAVKFLVSSKFQEGNLVFAVRLNDGSDDILWSWHLWFTDYNPDAIAYTNRAKIVADSAMAYTRSGYDGAVQRYSDNPNVHDTIAVWRGIYQDKFIMDRNIGERSNRTTDCGVGTVYYQFGRKDPFPGSSGKYDGKVSEPGMRSSSGLTFIQSVEYVKDFFTANASASENWSGDENARRKDILWFDADVSAWNYTEGKSIFDPSPLGWRIPVIYTWNNFYGVKSSQCDYFDVDMVGGKYYYDYGYRSPILNRAIYETDGEGYVWSANQQGEKTAYSFYFCENGADSAAVISITYGLPIRPIEE